MDGKSDGSTSSTRSRLTAGKSLTSPLCIHSQRSWRNGWQFVRWTAVPVEARMCAKNSGEVTWPARSRRFASFQAGSMPRNTRRRRRRAVPADADTRRRWSSRRPGASAGSGRSASGPACRARPPAGPGHPSRRASGTSADRTEASRRRASPRSHEPARPAGTSLERRDGRRAPAPVERVGRRPDQAQQQVERAGRRRQPVGRGLRGRAAVLDVDPQRPVAVERQAVPVARRVARRRGCPRAARGRRRW